jgi:conjugative transfer signal peptidase TraF
MTPRGPFKAHRRLHVAIVAAVTFAAPFLAISVSGIKINISPSLPLGLYRKTSDLHARLTEFCPAEPYARLAIERGYRSAGRCPDGGAPLMKSIVAIPGDVVDISPRGIIVNGILLPNTRQKVKDSKGRPMRAWPSGKYHVDAGFVWVVAAYNPWSYDSRYFGPIPIELIRSHLEPLITAR